MSRAVKMPARNELECVLSCATPTARGRQADDRVVLGGARKRVVGSAARGRGCPLRPPPGDPSGRRYRCRSTFSLRRPLWAGTPPCRRLAPLGPSVARRAAGRARGTASRVGPAVGGVVAAAPGSLLPPPNPLPAESRSGDSRSMWAFIRSQVTRLYRRDPLHLAAIEGVPQLPDILAARIRRWVLGRIQGLAAAAPDVAIATSGSQSGPLVAGAAMCVTPGSGERNQPPGRMGRNTHPDASVSRSASGTSPPSAKTRMWVSRFGKAVPLHTGGEKVSRDAHVAARAPISSAGARPIGTSCATGLPCLAITIPSTSRRSRIARQRSWNSVAPTVFMPQSWEWSFLPSRSSRCPLRRRARRTYGMSAHPRRTTPMQLAETLANAARPADPTTVAA